MSMPKGYTYSQKTDEEYIEAIKDSHGILNVVARKLGIERQAVQAKMKKNPELKALLDSERDVLIDNCEERLYKCIEKDSFPAIQYALKTIGAARGWGENQTLNITKKEEEEEYDLSSLTEEEKAQLEYLTNKIYKAKPS